MRKIRKTDTPLVLRENAQIWTDEYLHAKKTGTITKEIECRYNHPEIKEALKHETHGKCVYCEAKIVDVSYGDIDHIIPKSVCPELYVEWTNLTLSCELCNRSGKRDYYDANYPIINPYTDNVDDFLFDYGAFVFPKDVKGRGKITIEKLKLNRPELIASRQDKIKSVESLFELWAKETNEDLKSVLKNELLELMDESAEFSSTIRGYCKAADFEL